MYINYDFNLEVLQPVGILLTKKQRKVNKKMQDEEIREPFKKEIKEFMKKNKLKNKEAAELLNIKLSTFNGYLNGNYNGYGYHKMPYKNWIILQKKVAKMQNNS